jgi:hypothetical protein
LKGIPVLRDNLTLAGFHPSADNYYETVVENLHLVIAPTEDNFYRWWVNGAFVEAFQFIHEMQNLFQDATGKILYLNMVGAKQ